MEGSNSAGKRRRDADAVQTSAPSATAPRDGSITPSTFATPAPAALFTRPPAPAGSLGQVTSLTDLTLIRPISRGAHSKVWLALQRTAADGRYFALKVMSKERLRRAGAAEVQAVRREKLALQALQPHPYITQLVATFQVRGRAGRSRRHDQLHALSAQPHRVPLPPLPLAGPDLALPAAAARSRWGHARHTPPAPAAGPRVHGGPGRRGATRYARLLLRCARAGARAHSLPGLRLQRPEA